MKKERPRKQRQKNDPRLVSAARELRDRWLEEVNSGALQLQGRGKYEIGRAIEEQTTRQLNVVDAPKLCLPAAA